MFSSPLPTQDRGVGLRFTSRSLRGWPVRSSMPPLSLILAMRCILCVLFAMKSPWSRACFLVSIGYANTVLQQSQTSDATLAGCLTLEEGLCTGRSAPGSKPLW